MSELRIGWGTKDITPKGGALSLEGQFETRITNEILDPMFATAMAVQKDGVTSIWVSIDSCHVFRCLTEAVDERLSKALPGYRPEMLMIAATHIHTGPYHERGGWLSLTGNVENDKGALTDAQCRAQMADKIAEAVIEAMGNMKASVLEMAIAPVITGTNRRTVYRDGSAKMYGDIRTPDFWKMEYRDGGPSQLIYVYGAKDRALTGVIANVPATAQCDEHGQYITADYWATTRKLLREAWGEDLKILSLCRAAGDLSPHPMIDRIYDDKPFSGPEPAREMGAWVAQFIQWFRDRAKPMAADALCQVSEIVRLPVWKVSKEAYEAAKAYMADPAARRPDGKPADAFKYANAWTQIRRVEVDEKSVDVRVTATRLGDAVIYSAPFEMYIAYADRIRAAIPGAVLMDVELTYDNLGYLPTPEAVSGGHYSANIFNGVCDPEGGQVYEEKAKELIRKALGRA